MHGKGIIAAIAVSMWLASFITGAASSCVHAFSVQSTAYQSGKAQK
jgi:hypothetical protein